MDIINGLNFDNEMDTIQSSAPHTLASFPSPQFSITPRHITTPLATSINNPPSSSMPWSSFTHFPSTTISYPNNNQITPIPMLQEHDQTPEATFSKKRNSMAAMREMIFRVAAMQPIHIDSESVKPPKRKNVKISKDPQSVAARLRRERISERIRILQRMVPGGTKMDTASMLDEAIHYLKFLKTQVQLLQRVAAANSRITGFPYLPLPKPYQASQLQSTNNIYDYR